MTIKEAQLEAIYHRTNPPKLIGFHVVVDDVTVAVITTDKIISAYAEYMRETP